jgi:hypothetical protein
MQARRADACRFCWQRASRRTRPRSAWQRLRAARFPERHRRFVSAADLDFDATSATLSPVTWGGTVVVLVVTVA